MSEVVLDSAVVHSKLAKIAATWTKVSNFETFRQISCRSPYQLLMPRSNLVFHDVNTNLLYYRYTKRKKMRRPQRPMASSSWWARSEKIQCASSPSTFCKLNWSQPFFLTFIFSFQHLAPSLWIFWYDCAPHAGKGHIRGIFQEK